MNAQVGFDRCLSFINCQLQTPGTGQFPAPNGEQRRAVTLSRQAGSGSHLIAEKLAVLLDRMSPNPTCCWTVFDKNLVEKVLEDHNLPGRLAKFMAEDRISAISDTMDELFGLHPPSWTLVRKSSDTILHLAELGNVILIGRGAAVITRKLDHVLHVRLVGSFERRLAHVQEYWRLPKPQAVEFLKNNDRARQRFLKQYFNQDIDDPLLYHLMINTDLVPYDDAAQLIAETLLKLKTA